MRVEVSILLFSILGPVCFSSAAGPAPDARPSPVPEGSRQLVIVLTSGPDATTGRLARFERTGPGRAWEPVGASWPVVVGKTGLAEGLGLDGGALPGLAPKREGDGKSPAGVFALTRAFGFAPSPPSAEGGLPYLPLSAATECVDDPASTHYASIVERSDVDRPDWSSSERMREIDGYEWGVVVDHNPARVAGRGSCIFLHGWSGPSSPTVGCTAMELDHVRELVGWLRAEDEPVIAQLTESAFETLRERWRLPEPGP